MSITAKTLTKAILIALGGSVLLLTALLAPNALQLFDAPRKKRRSAFNRRQIYTAVYRLRKRGYVRAVGSGNGTKLSLTVSGYQKLKRAEFDNLQIAQPLRWDGIWRVVIFDVPEQYKVGRVSLRRKLRDLGFLGIQKSVFVHPFPCRGEINLIANFFKLRPFIQYLETSHLDQWESAARKEFDLV